MERQITKEELLELLLRWLSDRIALTIAVYASKLAQPAVFEGGLTAAVPSLVFTPRTSDDRAPLPTPLVVGFTEIQELHRIDPNQGEGSIEGVPEGWEGATRGLLTGVVLLVLGRTDGSVVVVADQGSERDGAFRAALLQAVARSVMHSH